MNSHLAGLADPIRAVELYFRRRVNKQLDEVRQRSNPPWLFGVVMRTGFVLLSRTSRHCTTACSNSSMAFGENDLTTRTFILSPNSDGVWHEKTLSLVVLAFFPRDARSSVVEGDERSCWSRVSASFAMRCCTGVSGSFASVG